MKKVIIALVVIVVLAFLLVYIFIPQTLTITETAIIPAGEKACNRTLEENNWQKWLPSETSIKNKAALSYNGYDYKLERALYQVLTVTISNDNQSYPATIKLLSLSANSTLLQLSTVINAGSDPVTKFFRYIEAQRLKRNIDEVIESYKTFMQKQENVYGLNIQQEKVKDTLLVSIKLKTTGYPSTKEVYDLVAKLKNYIQGSEARETNYPMLHVDKVAGENRYETMVAIPVDKPLEGTIDIKPKKMVAGKILVAEIKGGNDTIEEGLLQMEHYMDEHKKVSPAIPFQSLITDRSKQPDTLKWITKIYYPVL